MKIKVGDKVKVITGSNKGKEGKVLEIYSYIKCKSIKRNKRRKKDNKQKNNDKENNKKRK